MKTNTPTLMETKELNREMYVLVSESQLKHLFPNWILKSRVSVSSRMAQEAGLNLSTAPSLILCDDDQQNFHPLLLFKKKR